MDRVLAKHPKVTKLYLDLAKKDDEPLTYAFGVDRVPLTFLFDARGNLLTHFMGGKVEDEIEALLAGHGL